jgi:signal transduction histidine kinase
VSIDKRENRGHPPPLSFKARIFIALVGISSVTSLIIGLVLYYFAQDGLFHAENTLLKQRSQTANAGAQDFLEGLRDPEDKTLPPPRDYAEELVQSVADPTGLEVLYLGPDIEPLAARDGLGNPLDPRRAYEGLDKAELRATAASPRGEGRLVWSKGRSGYVAMWPLTASDGTVKGVLIYDIPRDELGDTLAYLRYGILGAILTSILLAGAASLLLTRQVTRPLSETRDAAIRVASGDYAATVPVKSRDELGEVARTFNYMAEEIEHYVGEIQEQKSRLEAVLEASPEAVVATDPGERVTMVNPAAARMLGIRDSDRGRTLEEIGAPHAVLRCLREAAADGVAVREVELGEKAYWAYAAQMDRGEDIVQNGGGNAGIILAVRDITEHRSLEKAKTAFVSDFSHELRTPLTTIQSAIGLLERARDRLDPLEHRALELADQESKRIRAMVEELLTLAQMDSWKYQLEVGPANLSTVVQTAIESVEAKAQRFGIGIYFGDAGEHKCICDVQKLYQVFINLLDNAIKYSDSGARVDVEIEEDVSSLTVRIRDTGVGIPKDDLNHLFERFYRVDKDRSRATGGSGLGLAISKQIVEMHGGSISVESEVDVGSVFEVRLPKAFLSRSVSHAL